MSPASEAELATLIRDATSPFAIEGHGSKRAMLRPVQAGAVLSTRGLTGVTLHRPTEMIVSARAGTPVSEVEAVVASGGQMLIGEVPRWSGLYGANEPTIGGAVAANASGPRRITGGAMRDHVMGIRFVNGAGEAMHSGGRVLKNVTGLDLCKLLTGSHGTLGVITEVTLKVLPKPEAEATLVVEVAGWAAGVAALSAGLGSPFGVSGAAMPGPGLALLRIEDFAESVAYRIGRLRALAEGLGAASVVEGAASAALWRAVREVEPLAVAPAEAVWRVSVKPSEGPRVASVLAAEIGARAMLDWGGGLVWLAGPATAEAHAAVMRAAAPGGFTLMRAPDALREAVAVIAPEPPALAAIARRVKAALDPRGLFNPGRMEAGA